MKQLLSIRAGEKAFRKVIWFVLLFVVSTTGLAQKETAVWYFGQEAGLDFNTITPTVLNNGKLYSEEGCATISNENGNLLFYTNGVRVYNRNHKLMLNGDELLGHVSSTQSALIIPDVSNKNRYYIFTMDGMTGYSKGLHFSVVDMNLDDGLGAVLPDFKNVFLRNGKQEKLTAVYHQNKKDIWVITCSAEEGVNEFYAYLLTEKGLNTTPVTSKVTNCFLGVGYLKASPRGDKLASAHTYNDGFSVFDFNNQTGKVSNQLHIDMKQQIPNAASDEIYGVEFSPSGRLVYVTSFFHGLFQFNIASGNQTEIRNSGQVIFKDKQVKENWGALQLGLDGKIYVARINSKVIGVINAPDFYGFGCDFNENAIKLEQGTCKMGFPQFMQGYFYPGRIRATQVCLGTATSFFQEVAANYDSLIWEFGDGSTSTQNNPKHLYTDTGIYTVTLTVKKGKEVIVEKAKATVHTAPQIAEQVTLKQCDDDQDGFTIFNLNAIANDINTEAQDLIFTFYQNQLDAESKKNAIQQIETYKNRTAGGEVLYARAENKGGCYRITRVQLAVSATIIPKDYEIVLYACNDGAGIGEFNLTQLDAQILALFPKNQKLQISYYRSLEDALTQQYNITDKLAYTNTDSPFSQELWLRVSSLENNDCVGLGKHVTLKVVGEQVAVKSPVYLCKATTTVLDAGAGFDSYLWSTGETTQNIRVDTPGKYSVTATHTYWNLDCSSTIEVEVISSELAVITDLKAEGWGREDNLVKVYVSGNGDYEFALDGLHYQNTSEFIDIDPSLNTVYIRDKNGCGVVQRTFYLLYYPKFFTPNGDGVNDFWQLQNASEETGNQLYVFDRYGKQLCNINANDVGWDGTFNGKPMPNSDYWFILKRQDGKTYKGHFALKR